MKSVYLETTVISYLTGRPSCNIVQAGHQEVTRQWWETRRGDFDLFISQLVIDEAGRGDTDAAHRRLAAITNLPLLDPTDETITVAESLLQRHALPRHASDDALHIALSAARGIDYLLTWNFKHIANAEKLWLIEATIRSHGLEPPIICTPEELLGGNHEERPHR